VITLASGESVPRRTPEHARPPGLLAALRHARRQARWAAGRHEHHRAALTTRRPFRDRCREHVTVVVLGWTLMAMAFGYWLGELLSAVIVGAP
jgi:hypothetical protein